MGLRDRLHRADDNAYSDFVHDQYTAPFTWWLATAIGLFALGLGIAKGEGVAVGVGAVLTFGGVAFSLLSRRRDRRLDNARRGRTETHMDQRHARRQGR